MGGGTQPQAHAQIVMNLVDFGMNLQEAGDAPRMLHTRSSEPTGSVMTDGGVLSLETGPSWETLRDLSEMGHTVQINVGSFGGYQAIMRDAETGVYYGASESRKDGQAGDSEQAQRWSQDRRRFPHRDHRSSRRGPSRALGILPWYRQHGGGRGRC